MTNITDYGTPSGADSDMTPIVRAAIEDLALGKSNSLVFPKGRYHFWPDRAAEEYLFISNNDESIKRIVFPLSSLADVEIDGGGSEFIFHGTLVPFVLRNCQNVILSNFRMNWERTYHSEAEIVDYRENDGTAIVDLRISDQFPYRIDHERLWFELEDNSVECLGQILEFDAIHRETARGALDNGLYGQYKAVDIGGGVVRITGKFHHALTPGNILVMTAGKRLSPGIAVLDSQDIGISDVTIHHCAGMGVIAQRTRNIDLLRFKVTPDINDKRMVSATADAAHFVNCAGLIRIDECLFENQMDDPVNIHGIYARISRIVSDRTIEIELVHRQQLGIDITQAGDTVEFVANENLLTYDEAKVESVKRLNKQFFMLTLETSLHKSLKVGDGVASLSWIPDVTITRTTSRNNRARGFLISTAGKVLIEDNYFHIPGAAILIAGDANHWFESGKVRDITIRNNHFDNCLFGVWGSAVIDIHPEIAADHRDGVYYHKNITIENNRFDLCDPRVLLAYCVDGLIFRDNQVAWSALYEATGEKSEIVMLEACTNVDIPVSL